MQLASPQIHKLGSYIGKYRIQYLIAGGSFGRVYLAVYNSKRYAIKQMVEPPKSIQRQLMDNEIKVLTDLNHENIVKLYAVIRERNYVYLVMEYCQTDMRDLIANKSGYFQQTEALKILSQIVNGMSELVKLNIVHRDIKPANILCHKGVFKIADFGLAKYLQDSCQMLSSRVGTPFYMAPQILKNQNYTSKCDIWSLGVIFYQLIFGVLPWYATNQQELIQIIINVPLMFPRTISNKTKKLLERMIAIQEYHRFSWEELILQINSFKDTEQMEKTFHRTTMQKLINIQLDRVSCASYDKKFEFLSSEQKKSVISLVMKFFNQQSRQFSWQFIRSKVN